MGGLERWTDNPQPRERLRRERMVSDTFEGPVNVDARRPGSAVRCGARGGGMSTGTRIVYETTDHSMTLATFGCLFVTIHRRDYSAEEVAPLRHHQLAFARERGAPFPLLTILDVTEMHIIRFGKPARDATLELARETVPFIRCSGVVFDRGGFAASAIRSLVTMVNLISKPPFPTHVFGDLGRAIEWIESKLDGDGASEFDRAAATDSVRMLRVGNAGVGASPSS
jgi:hypothetical protein